VEQAGCGLAVPLALFTGSLAVLSGALIGIVLGMIGGGGSILAVPLLVYVVGVPSIHVAIGTAAIAVAINAAFGIAGHARIGAVKWPCALVFAGAGSFGALAGSALGKATGADELLALFGGLLIAIGFLMLASPSRATQPDVRLSPSTAGHLLPRLLAVGTGVGLLSGYFGIGGGFLIVPGLMLATAMPLSNAVATSLVAVTAFGLTTAGSYAASGLIDWKLALCFVIGGAAGSFIGIRAGQTLGKDKHVLTAVFAAFVVLVGVYVVITGMRGVMLG
jgi:uncharacterized membrane protein YfcA